MKHSHDLLRMLLLGAPFACGAARPPDATSSTPAAAPTTPAATPPASAPTVARATDCADEPGMVFIAGGDTVYSEDRKTYHLADFWIDRTEVTVGEFRKFVEAGYSPPMSATGQRAELACTWQMTDADDLPINCIDWHQSEAYCLWAGKRLPTGPEWGWAARGREEQRKYPWGDAPPSCELAVLDLGKSRQEGKTGCGRGRPWPVGSKPGDTTRDGVVDMFGNVAEQTSTGTDPSRETTTRHGRGSSFATGHFASSTVDEHGGYVVPGAWSDNAGVRCAKDVGAKLPCGRTP